MTSSILLYLNTNRPYTSSCYVYLYQWEAHSFSNFLLFTDLSLTLLTVLWVWEKWDEMWRASEGYFDSLMWIILPLSFSRHKCTVVTVEMKGDSSESMGSTVNRCYLHLFTVGRHDTITSFRSCQWRSCRGVLRLGCQWWHWCHSSMCVTFSRIQDSTSAVPTATIVLSSKCSPSPVDCQSVRLDLSCSIGLPGVWAKGGAGMTAAPGDGDRAPTSKPSRGAEETALTPALSCVTSHICAAQSTTCKGTRMSSSCHPSSGYNCCW